jgi:trehalose-6-phosphatase
MKTLTKAPASLDRVELYVRSSIRLAQFLSNLRRAKKRGRRLTLLMNCHGTLMKPGDADLFPGNRELLTAAYESGHDVWVLTGSSVADVQREVGLPIGYVGCNGAEWQAPDANRPRILPEAEFYLGKGEKLWQRISQQLSDEGIEGVSVIPKPIGGKLSFLSIPPADRRAMRDTVIRLVQLDVQQAGFVVGWGDNVVDIRQPVEWTGKGSALDMLARDLHVPDLAFYAGDSSKPGTDLDAMLQARRLREHGVPIINIAVVGETTPFFFGWNADIVVNDVYGMSGFLQRTVDAIV